MKWLQKLAANFKKFYPMWKEKEITASDFARLIDVSRPTLYRYIKDWEG